MISRAFGDERITLKHGAGGSAMRALIGATFIEGAWTPPDGGIGLAAMDDGAALPLGDGRFLILTTDSHVVSPLFFPGGDIGRLAVCGTVNDLAMMGATEVMGLTCGVIVEEGFERALLMRVQESMRAASAESSAHVVTGDTKVMGKGQLDGLIINTAGAAITRRVVRDNGLKPGDRIIVTGTIGDHGFTVLAARNGLEIDGELKSDVAPLNGLIRAALNAGNVTALKDPTRGGLSSAIHEMAAKSGVGITLNEQAVPIRREVRAAAELLGIDPLLVANEGKAVLGVAAADVAKVLVALREHPLGREADVIGVCGAEHPGRIVLDTGFGKRLLTEPDGDPMPRIC